MTIRRWGRGVTTDGSIRMAISIHACMQQIDSRQVLRICNWIQARTHFSFGSETIWNPLRGHHTITDGATLVVPIGIEP